MQRQDKSQRDPAEPTPRTRQNDLFELYVQNCETAPDETANLLHRRTHDNVDKS